jgi:hypothetical protein
MFLFNYIGTQLFIALNIVSALMLLLIFKNKKKSYLIPIALIDISLPIIGFTSVCIFSILTPFYAYLYKPKLSEEENMVDAHELDLVEFDKELELQSAKSNTLTFDSIDENLFDSFQIQPYIDVILGDNTDMKVNACIKLSNFETTDSVKLLKKALQDKNYEVRYMANNALGQLEQNLLNIIDLLNENIKKHPATFDYYKERAINYIKIYRLGILDSSISKNFLKRAMEDLEFLVERNLKDHSIYLQLANVYINLEMNIELINFNKRFIDKITDEQIVQKMYFYEIEALFKEKRFNELITKSKQMSTKKIEFPFIKDITHYWASINE